MSGRLRRGEGSVTPYTLANGTQRWRARWWEDGRQRSASRATEAEAKALLIDKSTDKRLSRYIPASQITVMQACEQYLKRHASDWSTNTLASYRQVSASHIYPTLGKERIATLTTTRVQAWVEQMARRGLSTSTIRNARVILNATCADLLRFGEIARNPVTGVRLPRKQKSSFEVWDADQVREVLHQAQERYMQMATFYRVALTTGMRPGEVRALKWKDIDMAAGVITCQRTITRDDQFRQIVGATTKTHKSRTIAVPQSTITALQELRKDQLARRLAADLWNATDLVFDRGDGNLVAQQTLRNRHAVICKAAGVPQIRFHDLRHTAATMLLKAGVHPKIVSDILGHSSITITLDLYSHTDVSMQRAATDLLGDIAERKA